MNNRPFSNTHMHQHPRNLPRNFWQSLRIGACQGSLLLLTCLLLAGCWGDETPTPEATEAAAAPISALPTVTAGEAAAPTDTTTAATPEGIAAIASTPVGENATTTTTAAPLPTAIESPTPTFVPLEADAADDCEVESNLDLVGYPDLEERMGCATEAAIFDPIAINEFGNADEPINRFMLWFSHEGNIYVLLPDGSYQIHEDTWVEGVDPTFSCNPLGGEEDSPPLPRRGFGKLWCSDPNLQAIMGPVPREERLCQYAVLQRFENGRLLACFEDATIRYFRILDDGTWDLKVQ